MLVLTRKSGECIVIVTGPNGQQVTVRVVGVSSNGVRLGIEAPPEIAVYRKELLEQIKKENQGALLDEESVDLGEIAKGLSLKQPQG